LFIVGELVFTLGQIEELQCVVYQLDDGGKPCGLVASHSMFPLDSMALHRQKHSFFIVSYFSRVCHEKQEEKKEECSIWNGTIIYNRLHKIKIKKLKTPTQPQRTLPWPLA
jgi:hypothetical protein